MTNEIQNIKRQLLTAGEEATLSEKQAWFIAKLICEKSLNVAEIFLTNHDGDIVDELDMEIASDIIKSLLANDIDGVKGNTLLGMAERGNIAVVFSAKESNRIFAEHRVNVILDVKKSTGEKIIRVVNDTQNVLADEIASLKAKYNFDVVYGTEVVA